MPENIDRLIRLRADLPIEEMSLAQIQYDVSLDRR